MAKMGYSFQKWRMLAVTMFCYMTYYTGRQTFGFALPGIAEELGMGEATLGLFGTTLLWMYAIGQAINGNLGDKYGGRLMMSVGAWLSFAFNWVVSFGTGFWTLFLPWAGNGYVQAMGWAPGSRVLSNWWGEHERGRAFGFYMLAAATSSIIAFVMPLIVLQTLGLDWRWIFRLPVLLLLVGGTVYYLVVRNKPEDIGYESPHDLGGENGLAPEHAGKGASETSWERYWIVCTNWHFMAASLGIGFQSIARYGLLMWVPMHFLGADYRKAEGAWVSVALPVGMALGAVAGGFISDKIFNSVRWKLIFSFLMLAAVNAGVMYFLPRGHAWGIGFLFLCGFFVYGSQSAFWALCPDLLSNERAGTGIGVMDFFAYLFAGVGMPLIGHAIGSQRVLDPISGLMIGNTALVFPIVAFSCVLGAIIALFVKR